MKHLELLLNEKYEQIEKQIQVLKIELRQKSEASYFSKHDNPHQYNSIFQSMYKLLESVSYLPEELFLYVLDAIPPTFKLNKEFKISSVIPKKILESSLTTLPLQLKYGSFIDGFNNILMLSNRNDFISEELLEMATNIVPRVVAGNHHLQLTDKIVIKILKKDVTCFDIIDKKLLNTQILFEVLTSYIICNQYKSILYTLNYLKQSQVAKLLDSWIYEEILSRVENPFELAWYLISNNFILPKSIFEVIANIRCQNEDKLNRERDFIKAILTYFRKFSIDYIDHEPIQPYIKMLMINPYFLHFLATSDLKELTEQSLILILKELDRGDWQCKPVMAMLAERSDYQELINVNASILILEKFPEYAIAIIKNEYLTYPDFKNSFDYVIARNFVNLLDLSYWKTKDFYNNITRLSEEDLRYFINKIDFELLLDPKLHRSNNTRNLMETILTAFFSNPNIKEDNEILFKLIDISVNCLVGAYVPRNANDMQYLNHSNSLQIPIIKLLDLQPNDILTNKILKVLVEYDFNKLGSIPARYQTKELVQIAYNQAEENNCLNRLIPHIKIKI